MYFRYSDSSRPLWRESLNLDVVLFLSEKLHAYLRLSESMPLPIFGCKLGLNNQQACWMALELAKLDTLE